MDNNSDHWGLALSGADAEQAAIFNDIMQDYLHYRLSTFPKLKALCTEAPDFVMAQLLKGYLLLSMGTRGTVTSAQKIAKQIGANPSVLPQRESLHLQAMQAWARADTASAIAHWDQVLVHFPLDILAFKLQHFALFWHGQADYMRDMCARVMPAWDDAESGRGYALGMYAFALEEMGEYQRAEKLGREAVALNADDLWSIHAVAHVLEMQGRSEEGLELLDYPMHQWDDRNPFRGHVWWHAAMFALEKGDADLALSIYDGGVRSDESTFYLDVQNTASMLVRLEFAGVEVGDRWVELADVAVERQGDHVLLFTEPHNTMVLARTGRFDEVERQLASLRVYADDPQASVATLIKPLVLPVCEAIRDFYQGDNTSAIATLMPLRYRYQPMGGSHAQRDIFAIYLLDAVTQAGDMALQHALLTERMALHPGSAVTQARFQAIG